MREGFVYTADQNDPLLTAQPGELVRRHPFRPPFIVIDHQLERIRVNRWPGRLLRVRVLPPQDDAEREAFAQANSNLIQPPHYTRAFSVEILAVLPTSVLFGPHGDAVVEVVEFAQRLDRLTAARLAERNAPEAGEAYSAAWRLWLHNQGQYVDSDDNFGGVLAVSNSPAHSPVGMGLSLISAQVSQRARQQEGVRIDEEGEELLQEPWSSAHDALLYAAMALGAPDLVENPAPLLSAWRSLDHPS